MLKRQSYPRKYRAQAITSVFAIIFFILIYLLVLILSFAIVTFLFYSSVLVLKAAPGPRSFLLYFFSFVIIDVIAISLLIFIFQFFFRKQTIDRSGWIEITEQTQSKLFKLIESISKQLNTNFPQKVYLGAGVEAMVFYDSNFRNLFIPSKENLMIGLGLVNSMTDCEIKTIIAHEFGHFTQRSLNVYSYIYIENQIIYKMLMDEAFYQHLILEFSKLGKFSWIVIYYSRLVRWILRKAYNIVSKNYMALSREMEFHADELSARIGGSVPAISALMRAGLAADAFHYLWQFYYSKISENLKTENVYPQHKFVMDRIANEHGFKFINSIPQVSKEILSGFGRSKLVIENQWASHPSVEDRIKRLEDLNIESEVSYESAWSYFVNREELQKEITERLFRNWQFAGTPVILTYEDFEQKYMEEIHKGQYDERYSYFYKYRTISNFDLKSLIDDQKIKDFNKFAEIYCEENLNLIYQFTGLTNDIRTLDSISKGEFEIDIFEYDGAKYKSKQSRELCERLKKDHEKIHNKIVELDKKVFRFFHSLAKANSMHAELIRKYEAYFYLVEEDKLNLKVYLEMIDAIQFIYRVHSFSQINIKMTGMKEKENEFKERVKKLLSEEIYLERITDNQKEILQKYLSKNHIYFDGQKYDQDSLKILEENIFQFYEICSTVPYYGLKKLLDFQIEILEKQNQT